MRALVVFESMFGNTKTVAEAIGEGLAGTVPVEVVEVGVAPTSLPPDVALLVVGGPTHAFGLSRPGTRQDATRQAGGTVVSATIGLREWLEALGPGPGIPATTFDTRIDKPRMPGSAAKAAAKLLRKRGYVPAAKPMSFYVGGTPGPLSAGEVDRARAWGDSLAQGIVASGERRSA